MIKHHLSAGSSINECIAAMNEGDMLILEPGVYNEKVIVDKPNITIDGQNGAVISWANAANHIAPDGLEYNTFRTYTMHVIADNVTLKNLTIENTAGNPKVNGQCVALSVTADNFSAENCKLISTQDTLFCGPLPDDLIVRYIDFLVDRERYREGSCKQNFTDCYIEGSVDFIFGCGEAVFENCHIHSVNDGRDSGYIAAPAHSLKQTEGFLFKNCRLTGDESLKGLIFLARPWRDFGKASFIDCELGDHIHAQGFDKWNDTERNRTARFYYTASPKTKDFVSWAHAANSENA